MPFQFPHNEYASCLLIVHLNSNTPGYYYLWVQTEVHLIHNHRACCMIQLLCTRFSQNGNTVCKLCLTLSGGGSAVQIVLSLIILVSLAVSEQITLTNMTFTGNSCVYARVFMRVCRVCVYVICICIFMCVWAQEAHHRQCVKVRGQPRVLVFRFRWVWDRISPLLSPLWWQAGRLRELRLSCPCLPVRAGTVGPQTCAALPRSYARSEDVNSGPHTCMASAVTAQFFIDHLVSNNLMCLNIYLSNTHPFFKTCILCFLVVKYYFSNIVIL